MMQLEEVVERLAERFYGGEEHTSFADSITFHIVEIAVGVCAIVVIQAVTT